MKRAEFRAWLKGLQMNMGNTPTAAQWAAILDEIEKIDDRPKPADAHVEYLPDLTAVARTQTHVANERLDLETIRRYASWDPSIWPTQAEVDAAEAELKRAGLLGNGGGGSYDAKENEVNEDPKSPEQFRPFYGPRTR